MENNNCILITKKEYDALKAASENNNPGIKVSITMFNGSSSPYVDIKADTTFDTSERIAWFIYNISKRITNKINKQLKDSVESCAKNRIIDKQREIDKLKAEIEFLKNRGFWGRVFNVFD